MKLSELLEAMHECRCEGSWLHRKGARAVSNNLTALAAVDHLRTGKPFAALLALQGDQTLTHPQIMVLVGLSQSIAHERLPEHITKLKRVGL